MMVEVTQDSHDELNVIKGVNTGQAKPVVFRGEGKQFASDGKKPLEIFLHSIRDGGVDSDGVVLSEGLQGDLGPDSGEEMMVCSRTHMTALSGSLRVCRAGMKAFSMMARHSW